MKTYVYVMSDKKSRVKIGFSNNPDDRRDKANQNSFVVDKFAIYATYETEYTKKPDRLIHSIIDIINPNKRKDNKKEFYNLSPEKAVMILEKIALLTGTKDKLDIKTKTEINRQKRSANFKFSDFGIKKGAELYFKDTKVKCIVKNDREVLYKGKSYAISTLASKLLKELEGKDISVSGIHYFSYNGKRIISYKPHKLNKKN